MSDESIIWVLIQNTIIAALLAAAVYGLCRWGRLRPAVRHVLWLLVLLKLATPPVWNWPWSARSLWHEYLAVYFSAPSHGSADLYAGMSARLGQQPGESNEIRSLNSPNGERAPAGPDREEFFIVNLNSHDQGRDGARQETPAGVSHANWRLPPKWSWGLAGLWALAAAGMAITQSIRIIRFRRLLRRGAPAPLALDNAVRFQAKRLGIAPPQTFIVPHAGSPMVWGVGRPTLLWPAPLLSRLSPKSQEAVIVHELAHLRRRDHWVGWIQLLTGCVWWWHPLYRYVNRQVRLSAELACDAWVVNVLPRARRAYAEALLEVSQLISRSPTPAHAVGMAAGKVDLEKRLVMIMRGSGSCRLTLGSIVLVGLLALFALPGWSLSQQSKAATDDNDQTEPPAASNKPESANAAIDLLRIQLDDGLLPASLPYKVRELSGVVAFSQGDSDSDRLKNVEIHLERLLKEVQALKRARNVSSDHLNDGGKPLLKASDKIAVIRNRGDSTDNSGSGLTRAAYQMPKAKAAALAAFLNSQFNSQTLEAKVDGDALVIIAAAPVQHPIGQFIGLVLGRTVETRPSPADKIVK